MLFSLIIFIKRQTILNKLKIPIHKIFFREIQIDEQQCNKNENKKAEKNNVFSRQTLSKKEQNIDLPL